MSEACPSHLFSQRLIAWHARHGRHDLPWQNTRDPYRIWVSEIMLQQTQVAAVIPYYQRFLARFPDIAALAQAPLDEVLAHWSGLGYYARARNLHAAAQIVVRQQAGVFPYEAEAIAALPGIGRSTAAAIAAFAHGTRGAILDGNVKRVLARCFGIEGYPGQSAIQARLWALAESLLPAQDIVTYTQAMMDLGATLCTRGKPRCADCPVQAQCVAHRTDRTADLPSPKPARAVPQRETVMLILRNAGDILLEKRPASGIWGGLWSLPEIDAAAVLQAQLAERFGVQARQALPLPPFEHRFTHFRLHIAALLIETTAPPARGPLAGLLWLPLEEALCAALPTPVRRLLKFLPKP